MREVNRKSFVYFLLICSPQQFEYTLKTLTKNQSQVIVEIIFNVMKGICHISYKNKNQTVQAKTSHSRSHSSKVNTGAAKMTLEET